MEDSENSQPLPQLLDLIPDGREWKLREEHGRERSRNTGFGSEDDQNLELKLGLPGLVEEEIKAVSKDEGLQQESPALSLGYFPKPSKATNSLTTGAKRGFFDTVETRTEGRNEQKQQNIMGCGNKLAPAEKIAGTSEMKEGCSLPSPSHTHTAPSVRNSGERLHGHGRGASAPVVGWPPIRSFRKNLASSSSLRQPPETPNGEASTKVEPPCKKNPLVKINMDGIPIGRKVDLAAYGSYESLSAAVKDLFHGFLEAQNISSAQNGADEKIFSQLLDGSGEYTLIYEDNEGDRMLVGDVPWNVFVSTAKRLRVLRSSDLYHGLIQAASRRVTNC